MRQVGLDPPRRLDKIDRVVVVRLDAGRDREDVGIEDHVFGREADLVNEDPVGPPANADLVGERGRLALLIERHHDDSGAVGADVLRALPEHVFAFLQRDRIDDALALQALQACVDHLPLGGVDHERHLGDFGLAAEQLQIAGHRGHAVDHPFIHADVDDVGPVLDLLARHADGLVELALLDQLGELRRPGDVGALADHHEHARLLDEGLRPRKLQRLRHADRTAPHFIASHRA